MRLSDLRQGLWSADLSAQGAAGTSGEGREAGERRKAHRATSRRASQSIEVIKMGRF